MSGGTFDYKQWAIQDIAEHIENTIALNDCGELWEQLQPEVIEELKAAVKCLRQAYVYARRIDYLLAGDSGQDTFLKYLQQELKELQ